MGTPSPAVEVIGNLLKATEVGDTQISYDKEAEIVIGQTVVIDPGLSNEETGKVVGRGTLVLKEGLKFKHSVWAVVKGIATATTTPKATQTVTPASKYETQQQQVAGVPNLLLIVGLFVSAAIIALVFRAARKTRQSREIMIPLATDSDCPVE